MYGYWPLLTKQDALPAIPLASVIIVGLFFAGVDSLAEKRPPLRWAGTVAAALFLFFEARDIRAEHPLKQHSFDASVAMMRTVLNLTHPDEMVMDGKGETIFRPRPYYYALENITTSRMKFGLLADDIASHLIATRTALVHDFRLPDDARKFVQANYLPLAGQEEIYVLGQNLALSADGKSAEFTLSFPAEYCFVSEGQMVKGHLDDAPFEGSREVTAGRHRFTPDAPAEHLVLFAAKAYGLGYRPSRSAAPAREQE
jgi:hypothetical protein